MATTTVTLGQNSPNFGAKRAQLQKPAIHNKQLPVKCPKNNTAYWVRQVKIYSLSEKRKEPAHAKPMRYFEVNFVVSPSATPKINGGCTTMMTPIITTKQHDT